MSQTEETTEYEWQESPEGEATVLVHLEDGSAFALSPCQAERRYGVSRGDCTDKDKNDA